MGRLLGRGYGDQQVVRCAECGAEHHDSAELCWCGVTIPGHGKPFECVLNPQKRPDRPQEILVREKPL